MADTSHPIPLVVMEEHHEAFLIWHAAIRRGWMPATGNSLLHVDEHADLGAPRLRQPLVGTDAALSEVARFTFQELSCFEFIVPSMAQGMFDELLWLRQNPDRKSDQLVVVGTPQQPARQFQLSAFPLFNGLPLGKPTLPPGRQVRYRHQSIEDELPALRNVVLDIDLDYFSCEDAVNLVQKLEVSADEFQRFQNDRYHFLRIAQGSRIRVQEEDGRYFLYLRDYQQAAPTPLRVTPERIVERIDRMVDVLRARGVRPLLVDIARSRLSGYTPNDQWEFIEAQLIECLGRLWPLQPITMDELAGEVTA